MSEILELYNAIRINYGEYSKYYKTAKRIMDVLEEYNVNSVEDLQDALEEHYKSSEELYKCSFCMCKSLRASDRYCPECGRRVDD